MLTTQQCNIILHVPTSVVIVFNICYVLLMAVHHVRRGPWVKGEGDSPHQSVQQREIRESPADVEESGRLNGTEGGGWREEG